MIESILAVIVAVLFVCAVLFCTYTVAEVFVSHYLSMPLAMFFNKKNWVEARVKEMIRDMEGNPTRHGDETIKREDIKKVFDLFMLSIGWNAPDITIYLLEQLKEIIHLCDRGDQGNDYIYYLLNMSLKRDNAPQIAHFLNTLLLSQENTEASNALGQATHKRQILPFTTFLLPFVFYSSSDDFNKGPTQGKRLDVFKMLITMHKKSRGTIDDPMSHKTEYKQFNPTIKKSLLASAVTQGLGFSNEASILIDHGADPNQMIDGKTLLVYGLEQPHYYSVMHMLLPQAQGQGENQDRTNIIQKYADPNKEFGSPPTNALLWRLENEKNSGRCNNFSYIKYLIEHGASPDYTFSDGETVLMKAVQQRCTSRDINLLIKESRTINDEYTFRVIPNEKMTLLSFVVAKLMQNQGYLDEDLDLIRYLIEKSGANTDVTINGKKQILPQWASNRILGGQSILEIINERQAQAQFQFKGYWKNFHDFFTSKGAHLAFARSESTGIVLTDAVKYCSVDEMCKVLDSNAIDLNAVYESRSLGQVTILEYAIRKERRDQAILLIEKGADPNQEFGDPITTPLSSIIHECLQEKSVENCVKKYAAILQVLDPQCNPDTNIWVPTPVTQDQAAACQKITLQQWAARYVEVVSIPPGANSEVEFNPVAVYVANILLNRVSQSNHAQRISAPGMGVSR